MLVRGPAFCPQLPGRPPNFVSYIVFRSLILIPNNLSLVVRYTNKTGTAEQHPSNKNFDKLRDVLTARVHGEASVLMP